MGVDPEGFDKADNLDRTGKKTKSKKHIRRQPNFAQKCTFNSSFLKRLADHAITAAAIHG